MMINYEESVSLGIMLMEGISKNQWALGDLGIQFIASEKDGTSNSSTLVKFAHDIGLDERRMQEYTQLAKFYPVEVRGQFETLYWTHFRLAKRYCLNFEDALDALEYAASNALKTTRFEAWLVEHKNKPKQLKNGLEKAIQAIRELNPEHPLLSELERILYG